MPFKDVEQMREYKKKHYAENKAAYRQSRLDYRIRLRDEVNQIKEEKGCTDCRKRRRPFRYPYYVLQFDHPEDAVKVGSVNNLIRTARREVVLAEVKKCDVVCSNCHHVRSFKRAKAKKLAA